MDRRTFVALAGGALLGLSPNLRAQGQATPRRIGFLAASARAGAEDFLGLLRLELQELGWTDGRLVRVYSVEKLQIAITSNSRVGALQSTIHSANRRGIY